MRFYVILRLYDSKTIILYTYIYITVYIYIQYAYIYIDYIICSFGDCNTADL